jgi:dihydropyrimidinase
MKILIKNATIVNPDSIINADVLCSNGKITKIEKDIQTTVIPDKTIDASKLLLFPGGIDPHVHMHLPTATGFSSDDFLTGSNASLHGGTTTIIDFVTPKKGQILQEAFSQRIQEASNCLTNIYFHVSPIEWRESMRDEIQDCVTKFGIKSFKVYMAYKNSIGLEDDVLLKVMKAVAKAGAIITVHCETGDDIEKLKNYYAKENKLEPKYHPLSRPAETESKAVKRALEMANEANCPIYIVHTSSKESLFHIREAKKRGQKVFAETCPQYLLLDDSKYLNTVKNSSQFVMSPPLRKVEDNEALWEAIKDGTIDTIGTDHCPFNLKQKLMGKNDFRKIPNGAGGVEHRMELLYTFGVLKNKISLNEFVTLTSTNAAEIFGLFPEKGNIKVGSDADIVIWNPKKNKTISLKNQKQNCDLNIYSGTKTTGAPAYVLKSGKIMVQD